MTVKDIECKTISTLVCPNLTSDADSDLEGAFEDLPVDDRDRELKEVKAVVEARLKQL